VVALLTVVVVLAAATAVAAGPAAPAVATGPAAPAVATGPAAPAVAVDLAHKTGCDEFGMLLFLKTKHTIMINTVSAANK
jgi:hypothetical protein